MRQQSGKKLSWVTILQGSPTKISVLPLDIPLGDYELILESFDESSALKSTLQEDIIILRVQELPIVAMYSSCTVTSVRFAKSEITIHY